MGRPSQRSELSFLLGEDARAIEQASRLIRLEDVTRGKKGALDCAQLDTWAWGSEEEAGFPLAFAITAHQEPEQLFTLLQVSQPCRLPRT